MSIQCPLVTQNLASETPGTLKICCEMQDLRDQTTGEIITRKTHTAQEAFYSPEFQAIRENFKNGIRDPHCVKCWQAEDSGSLSRRMIELDTVGYNPTVDLKYMTVSLGNTCNIKCRTCGSRDSTFWLKEEYDLDGQHSISFKDYRKQKTVDLLNDRRFYDSFIKDTLPQLVDLSFLGGEPLMIPEFWNIVETVIELGLAQDITLNINTNCTIWEQHREELLSKFSKVNLFCSIDGIGPRFEYMRHPAQWSRVSDNLEKMKLWQIRSPGRTMTLLPAVSSYNVWYLKEILDYAVAHDVPVQFRPVVVPDHLSIVNLPQNIKELVKDRVPTIISAHMNSMIPSQIKWQAFLESLKQHDQYRNESFARIFGEYAKLLGFEG